MKLNEAKEQFISSWGVLGAQWGINRTMAQIHALLLTATDAMSAEEIMEALQISRGNANMNIRDLIEWRLVDKVLKPGERREFFTAEKDMWKVAMRIIDQRKRRELDPMIHVLSELKNIEGDKKDKDVKSFTDMITSLEKFAGQGEKALNGLIKADENWFTGTLLKLFK